MKQTTRKIHCVVYIITKLELGGAQKVCCALVNALEKSDRYTTKLVCGSGGILDQTVPAEKTIFLGSLHREITGKSLINECVSLWKLIKQLRALRTEYETVIVHTHSSKAGIIGRWAAFFACIPTRVHTVHGYAFHGNHLFILRAFIFIIEWITSLITTHFIVVSSADVATGKQWFPYFNQKYTLIRAAVAPIYFTAARTTMHTTPPPSFTIGTVSCFKPQKNILDLLRAFHVVQKKYPSSSLEIIGDGRQRPLIELTIQQLQLQNVTLHGWQKNPHNIMLKWDIFVLTSLWEGLPCSVVEARLMKLPVVTYNTGGIPDIIRHKKNGLIFEKGDWQGIAQGILQLISNKKRCKEYAHYKDTGLAEFSHQWMARAHEKLYDSLRRTV